MDTGPAQPPQGAAGRGRAAGTSRHCVNVAVGTPKPAPRSKGWPEKYQFLEQNPLYSYPLALLQPDS